MEELSTNIKGSLTELKCQTYFLELGYVVSIPISPLRYDFILDTGTELLKVQVKTCNNNNPDVLTFATKSSHYKKEGYERTNYKNEIDYFCTYYDNQCYLIPIEECGSSEKKLRLVPTKNGQVKNICFAKDYIAKEVLEKR